MTADMWNSELIRIFNVNMWWRPVGGDSIVAV